MGFDDSRSKVSISAVFPGASGCRRERGPEVGGEEGDGDRVSVRSYRSRVGGLVSLVQPAPTPDGPVRPGAPLPSRRLGLADPA
jgi:hypothetical protein